MITPAYGLTATERVLPRLALDFTTASLDPRVTFTRTGDTATVINSSGVITTALANVPRFDYNPSTLTCRGLLIEESRTNLLIRSIPDLAVPTGYTVVVGSGTYTHTLQNGFGVLSGFQQVVKNEQTVSGRSALNIAFTLAASTTYTLSIYVDKVNSAITSGSTTILQVANYADATGTLAATLANADANGRIAITFTTGADTIGNIRFGIGCAGDAVGVIYMAGWQLEVGAFATSYIPTTTTSVTRNADVATMTGTNFSDWFNASEGAFVAKTQTASLAATRGVLGIGDSSLAFAARTSMYTAYTVGVSGKIALAAAINGASQFSTLSPVYTESANSISTSAFAYANNNWAISVNGVATATSTSGSVPSAISMSIGNLNSAWTSGAAYINGYIQKIFYYPQRLTNAELRAFSK